MKKCIHTFKIENMPLQPSTIYFCPWQMSQSAFLPVKPYILIGNHVRVKSSGLARGLANARPPGSATFANAPPPGLTRRANAPQLPGGELGAGGIDWCIKGRGHDRRLSLDPNSSPKLPRKKTAILTMLYKMHCTSWDRPTEISRAGRPISQAYEQTHV